MLIKYRVPIVYAVGLKKWAVEYNERAVDVKPLTENIQGEDSKAWNLVADIRQLAGTV